MRLRRNDDLNRIAIKVSSVTYAIKVTKLFERAGIKTTLIKSDSSETDKGCTYGVNIDSSFLYDAVSILKKYGIAYSVDSGQ